MKSSNGSSSIKKKRKASAPIERLAETIKNEQPPRVPFAIVGIGASAGGLEALIDLFKVMPSDRGFAFVVIQHLPPDRESMLAKILEKHTRMPVLQVKDGMKVERNHVYVIRPSRTLTLHRRSLKLGEPISKPARRRPVDDFFRSLAEEQRERAICVIMSGMGSNGTVGAQAVKAVGGLCIAQDPDSAKFPSMPRTLIDSGLADFVLPPEEIPAAIDRYDAHTNMRGESFYRVETGRERQAFDEILALTRAHVRHDFSLYRKPTVIRRIRRRMGLNLIATMADYVRFLRQSIPEVHLLADDLLLHVTGFFRDPEVWQALRTKVIEPMVAERPDGASIRAWVTACSSGEEAYSLAMILMEAAEAVNKRFDIKIFATDTAERSLNQARASLFAGGIESEVSPERLKRFFEPADSSYCIKKELRELVVFVPQNVLQDPPFSRLDICTCRNFLIYLEPALQRRAIDLLHFSLREGGFLLLGNSENISGANNLFETIDRKNRIFRRIGATRHGGFAFPMAATTLIPDNVDAKQAGNLPRASIAQLARKVLLDNFTPAAVVIDQKLEIVYFHGSTNRYFKQPKGGPTRELMSVVRKSLRPILRSIMSRAMARKKPRAVSERVPASDKSDVELEISVSPLGQGAKPIYYLISFSERSGRETTAPAAQGATASRQRLARERQQTRDELQNTIDELQASNKEMKAAHEETISVNEELQSTNEELETSKEELQSLNQELTTVNAQLQVKMEELESSTNHMSSLLKSTDIAVVFLDPELRIRRYTPAVKDLFELIPSDIGRPLCDLALKFSDPMLLQSSRSVLKTGSAIDAEIVSNSGRTYVRRVLPYRKTDHPIQGVVLTFVDITARKAVEVEMRASENRNRLILEGIKEYGIFMLSLEGRFVTWTAGAERILGYSAQEARGKHLSLIHTEEDRAEGFAEKDLNQALKTGRVLIERWHVRKDRSKFWATGILSLLKDEYGQPYGFVKVVRDNTDRKFAEDELRNAMINAEAANASKDHFMANVSHELRTPLSATLLWAKLLGDQAEMDPELLREGLSAINRSAKEQQALIEDLMDASKIVAGKMRLESKVFNLNGLLQNMLPPMRSLAAEKQLVIDETFDPKIGWVEADPRRIQQVVSNLLNNAIKFTPTSGRISVQTARKGDMVTIRVADTGKGIGKEFLSRIFDRFVQIDQGSTPTASGMGLGLAIAKQLVEMHEGTIRAESAGKDRGTVFTLNLPLPRLPDTEAGIPLEPSSKISLAPLNILLVEDTAETRNALETVLTEAGAHIIPVGTAKDALKEFERSPPDLILSDIGLGSTSGHDLIAEIRKREKNKSRAPAPALALTAYADEKNRRKAFESGFQDCTTKPIEPSVLIAKLASLAGKR
jgi:two-component system CheB/CheR fusion protein